MKVSICAFTNLVLKSGGILVGSGKKKAILRVEQKIKELLIFILSGSRALNGELSHRLIQGITACYD